MLKLDEVLKWELEMEDQFAERMGKIQSTMEDSIEKRVKIVESKMAE
jgi:hypothetical protein